jgi:hypothetical protein
MNDIRWILSPSRQQRPADTADWWAACESGHEFWSGPDRDSYEDAKHDATRHDDDVHSGIETAVVLN